jgi:hypothetical protein
VRHWLRSLGLGLLLAVSALPGLAMPLADVPPIAQRPSEEPQFIRPRTTCPDRLEDLMPLLLRDLPSYANRVSQRAYLRQFRVTQNIPGTVIVAGLPELAPIELASREYVPQQEDTTRQAFFTTLERQYVANQTVDLEHYHWLILTPTPSGWRFVLLFSAIGNAPPNAPPTPPQDTSQGVVAQAIRLWLRDCRAGRIVGP